MAEAKSGIRKDGILGINTSPPLIFVKFFRTNVTPWSNDIQNLVILVSVIGKNLDPVLSNSLKKGIIDPLDPTTFPYLTTEKVVLNFPERLFAATKSLSAANFVAP